MAYKMACDAGIIPQLAKKGIDLNTKKDTPEGERAAIREIAIGLVEGAIERQRYFEMESPEIEEIEGKLKKAKEKKGASL